MVVLLESFELSLPDNANDIVWNVSGVRFPSVGYGNSAKLPMKVTPIVG